MYGAVICKWGLKFLCLISSEEDDLVEFRFVLK